MNCLIHKHVITLFCFGQSKIKKNKVITCLWIRLYILIQSIQFLYPTIHDHPNYTTIQTNNHAQKDISTKIDDISQNNTTCNYLDQII